MGEGRGRIRFRAVFAQPRHWRTYGMMRERERERERERGTNERKEKNCERKNDKIMIDS
jgi:hypothetical protein